MHACMQAGRQAGSGAFNSLALSAQKQGNAVSCVWLIFLEVEEGGQG